MAELRVQALSWWRRRQLAGDRRAGSWVRAEAARREIAFLRSQWRRFAVASIVAGLFIACLARVLPAGFVRGLVVGACGAGVVAMFVMLTREATGTSATRSGATAEQWTASELRPLQRAGWRVINHFHHWGEIDHLLVGPAGVVVVETKWSGRGWAAAATDDRLQLHLRRLRERRKQVALTREVKERRSAVHAVLFLWGGSASDASPDTYELIDGVTVIRGHAAAVAWRAKALQTPATLDADQIEQISAAVNQRIIEADRKELARAPVPPSIERVYWTLFACFCAASAALILTSELFAHHLDYELQASAVAIALLSGLAVRKRRTLRLIADAWLAGVAGIGLVAVLVFIAG